jgi:hypothetical protein
VPDLQPTRPNDRSDGYSRHFELIVELKCRRTHYDELVIERAKYLYLTRKAASNGLTAFYICSTPEGVYEWNLSTLEEPKWRFKGMPATTDFERNHFVQKEVGFVHIDQARQIHF